MYIMYYHVYIEDLIYYEVLLFILLFYIFSFSVCFIFLQLILYVQQIHVLCVPLYCHKVMKGVYVISIYMLE